MEQEVSAGIASDARAEEEAGVALPARPALIASLTPMRFFAAVFVALHHATGSWPHSSFVRDITHFGWLGVSFFFILSGFVLMWNFDPQVSAGQFMLRRLARIYPLHFVCLVAALAIHHEYGNPMAGYIGTTPGTIANFLLVHDWIPGHPEIRQAWNGVSWSLSCELFFYVTAPFLFPLLIKAFAKRSPLPFLGVLWAGIYFVGVNALLKGQGEITDFIEMYPVPRLFEFIAGACAALMLKRGVRFPSPWCGLFFMLAPSTAYNFWVSERGTSVFPSVLLFGVFIPGASLMIPSLAKADLEGRTKWLAHPVLTFLGESSYALYMTQAMVLGMFATYLLRPIGRWMGRPTEAPTVAFVGIAIVVASIVHIAIEQPLRIYLLRLLKKAAPRVRAPAAPPA